jgi:hypothetical protein
MARPRKYSAERIEAAAKRYKCCQRTIQRWLDAGVNVDSLEAVANHLLGLKAPKTETMKTITDLDNEF